MVGAAGLPELGVEEQDHRVDLQATDQHEKGQDAEARTEPATDAWDRLRAYLERTLGG